MSRAWHIGTPYGVRQWGGLFRAGEDFLVARDPTEMREHLRALCADEGLRLALARVVHL